jgi:7-cyano-7-deazaguanine reductase
MMTDYSKAGEAKTEVPDGFELTTIPTRGHRPIIEWVYPEFQCLCPVSGRHDQGRVRIKYKPDKKILESKSVRDYLVLWRNRRSWQEYVTEEIASVLYRHCDPKWILVEIEWAPRGGIAAKTISRRGRVPGSETY